MTKRQRLTGKERREERRRARQVAPWLSRQLVLGALGGMAAVGVTLAIVVFVFGGDDGATGQATAPQTPTPDTSGPPPTSLEPTVSDSGLGVIDLVAGNGDTAAAGKVVSVNYTGWLSDGTQFATSVGGSPFTVVIGVGDVIPGWDEGVVGMAVGGKRRLIVPPDLAYGAAGRPPAIPGDAELTFDIELLAVNEPTPTPAATPTP